MPFWNGDFKSLTIASYQTFILNGYFWTWCRLSLQFRQKIISVLDRNTKITKVVCICALCLKPLIFILNIYHNTLYWIPPLHYFSAGNRTLESRSDINFRPTFRSMERETFSNQNTSLTIYKLLLLYVFLKAEIFKSRNFI